MSSSKQSLASSQISSQLSKALKNIEVGVIGLGTIPRELCIGENIDLSRWTLVLSDDILNTISALSQAKRPHFYIDTTKSTLPEMFLPFWFSQVAKDGLISIKLAGAKGVSDYGVTKIARKCPNLKEIDISGCTDLTDVSVREIGLHCPNLQIFSISSCHRVEGSGLTSVAECCPKLIKLNLSRCKILQRWAISKIFFELKRLEEVDVSNLPVVGDDEIRVLAQNNPRLITLLAADSVNVSDTGILSLSQHCPDIDCIDVSRREMPYKLTDVGLLALGQRSSSLRILRANGCEHITDVGLSWLAEGCSALEELLLAGCGKITDAGLRSVGDHCHSMTYIDLSRVRLVSDIGITSITTGCPSLKRIICSGLYLLADPRTVTTKNKKGDKKDDMTFNGTIGVAAISKYCPNLETLDLSGCFRLNIVFQKHVSKKLLYLKKLNLNGCYEVSTESLMAIGCGCKQLEEIFFADCGPGVTTQAVQAFTKNCKSLKTIVLSRCGNVKATTIKAISHSHKLEKLDLAGCLTIDDEALLPLCEDNSVPKLRHLTLTDCPGITDTGLAWMGYSIRSLVLVALKGTAVKRHAISAVRECFKFSDMVVNTNFVGFWPKPQYEDRLLMSNYSKMIRGIITMQSKCRQMRAMRRVDKIRFEMLLGRSVNVLIRFARKIIGRNILKAKRAELALRKKKFSIVSSFLFHMLMKRKLRNIRKQKRNLLEYDSASKIQNCWRVYVAYRQMLRDRAAYLALMKLRDKSAITIQSLGRMYFGKTRVWKIKAWKQARMKIRLAKAIELQRIFRGFMGREIVRKQKEYNEQLRLRQIISSIQMQKAWRESRTRLAVTRAREVRERKKKAIVKIQAAARGRLVRWEVLGLLTQRKAEIRDHSALLIQTRWRVKQARLVLAALIAEAEAERVRREEAAFVMTRAGMIWSAKLQLIKLRNEHIEAVRQRILAEIRSATKIQSLFRGIKGRRRVKELVRQKKGLWKELFDEDKKQRFFYNKLTGEIRWRMPQDLLDLIPKPCCDNCCFYEGTVECGVCNEVFCGECWDQIHRGGRRKEHDFRALYDYYGKRIDYGDELGEDGKGMYPSKWPTEMIQDEIQGWMLRVAPIRDPLETVGDWEHYRDVEATDKDGYTVWKDFFFNRHTFEASYVTPDAFTQSQYQVAGGDTGYSYEQSYDQSAYDQTSYDATYDSSNEYYNQNGNYYDGSGNVEAYGAIEGYGEEGVNNEGNNTINNRSSKSDGKIGQKPLSRGLGTINTSAKFTSRKKADTPGNGPQALSPPPMGPGAATYWKNAPPAYALPPRSARDGMPPNSGRNWGAPPGSARLGNAPPGSARAAAESLNSARAWIPDIQRTMTNPPPPPLSSRGLGVLDSARGSLASRSSQPGRKVVDLHASLGAEPDDDDIT